jgi:hypothetical protein
MSRSRRSQHKLQLPLVVAAARLVLPLAGVVVNK